VKEEILQFFKGDVLDDEATLLKYSTDASLLEVRPQVVVYPKDKEDVQNLVRWVNENKTKYPNLSITPRCAGTCMSGGAIGESIILDFTKYMNRLVGGPLPAEDGTWTITVEPGMFYRDFEKITLAKGLILPCYTASKSLNAVGGMYGNNSAGERTLKYGKTEDYVLEAKVVFSDGQEHTVKPLTTRELHAKFLKRDFEGTMHQSIYTLINEHKDEIKNAKPNVHKNSAGYYIWNVLREEERKTLNASEGYIFDLNKLLVGSQGTLGIVTEITFKIIPETKYSKLVAIFMNDLEPLGRLVDEALHYNPETLEAYDDKTMKLAVKFFPDFLKNKGFVGSIKFLWGFLPEFKMMLLGGFPKMIVLAEFAGTSEELVHAECEKLKKGLENFKLKVHITKDQQEANKYWDIRRESFALLRKHVKGARTAPFIDDIIVRPEFLPKFLPELNKILDQYDLTYTIAGHAGDGNFHIIPLMNFSLPDTAQIITELSDKVYDLVLRYRGSITAEHNDGIIRTPYLEQMYGKEVTALFAQIKHIFDPLNIFNPGKKVPIADGPGTKKYLSSHIVKEHNTTHNS